MVYGHRGCIRGWFKIHENPRNNSQKNRTKVPYEDASMLWWSGNAPTKGFLQRLSLQSFFAVNKTFTCLHNIAGVWKWTNCELITSLVLQLDARNGDVPLTDNDSNIILGEHELSTVKKMLKHGSFELHNFQIIFNFSTLLMIWHNNDETDRYHA